MSQVEELQMRICNLPIEDCSKLREWFVQLEDELWDQKIRADFKAGKFNKLKFFAGSCGTGRSRRIVTRCANSVLG